MTFNDTYPARNAARVSFAKRSLKSAKISARATTISLMMAAALSACGGDFGDDVADSPNPASNTANTGAAAQAVVVASNNQPLSKGDAPAAEQSQRTNKQEQASAADAPVETTGSTQTSSPGDTASESQTIQRTSNATPPTAVPTEQSVVEQNTPVQSEPKNQTQTASTAVNNLDTIVDDMALLNDLKLVGVNPSYGFSRGPGYNTMGNNPSGENLPDWYLSSYPEMANTGYWKSIIPWFVLFEGEGNAASNTRIQMRNMKLYILSRSTNQWSILVSEQDMGGEFCPQGSDYLHCTGGDNQRSENDGGGISFMPMDGNDFHGWYGGRTAIDGADIKAVFVTMQSRLLVDSSTAADDRDSARYLFDVGADYYPEMGPSKIYLPGVGVSRAKLITSDWRSFNFMTFSDVGKQEPGGGISEAEFRENPPPLE